MSYGGLYVIQCSAVALFISAIGALVPARARLVLAEYVHDAVQIGAVVGIVLAGMLWAVLDHQPQPLQPALVRQGDEAVEGDNVHHVRVG